MSPRFALRAATAHAHEVLDRLVGGLDLGDQRQYGVFLRAQAAAFLPMESALEAAGVIQVTPDWPQRRRSAALRQDLLALGEPEPASFASPAFSSPEAMLGALYVLEGSRLGGAMLRRRVPDGWPVAFLSAADPILWRSLVERIDTKLANPADLDLAVVAARAVFALFERAARAEMRVDPS